MELQLRLLQPDTAQNVLFAGEEDIERQSPNVYRMKLLGADVCPVTQEQEL